MTKSSTTEQSWSNGRFLFLSVLVLSFAFGEDASAQAVLYDNLDNVRFDEDRNTATSRDVKYAQQFLTGAATNLDQVTVKLQRPLAGATGSISFELWRDNGSNQPMPVGDPTSKVAELGTILDVTEISVGSFDEIEFDNLILDLQSNSSYWVVLDYSGLKRLPSRNRSVGWAATLDPHWKEPNPPSYEAAAGTNGAVSFHGFRNADPFWVDLADLFRVNETYFAMSVEAADLPNDFVTVDMMSSAIRQSNTDGKFDLTGDGLVTIDDHTHWVHAAEFGNTFFGDANLDGQFNSSDLTLVFEAGEYEDNITLNSSWSEGDWNADGDFDSGDLVAAFQDGGYELGERNAVSAVPEPSCAPLLVIGMIGLCRVRKRRL